MSNSRVACILCQRSKETKITGTLSTKDEVTAHQNCLLFSAGIFCRDSPQFDDLFGFSVGDVLNEVKRGSKLTCNHCKKRGATAGCEVKRCKKSYHYPCALKEGATTIEDDDHGRYVIYCSSHSEQQTQKSASTNEFASSTKKPRTSKKLKNSPNPNTPGPSKNTDGEGTAAGSSVHSYDSSSSNSTMCSSSKRQLSDCDKREETLLKPKLRRKRRLSDSSNSVDNDNNTPMDIYALLESDIDENAYSVPELETVPEVIRSDTKSPAVSLSGNRIEDEFNDEDDTIIESDAESESLLLPVKICIQTQSLTMSAGELSPQTESAPPEDVLVNADVEPVVDEHEGSSPKQNAVQTPGQLTGGSSVSPPPSPGQSKSPPPYFTSLKSHTSPPCTSSATALAPPERASVSINSSSSSPVALPSSPEPKIDSSSFWKSCNAAGCTEAIFTDFLDGMKNISSKIQSDQASQEEYDLALSVMAASGKLSEFVAKQQEELQKKQMELQKAAAAMKDVVSALRK
ncbi:cell wall protein RBR3 isoform X2 [Pundamilia nyererei]|uniref:Cell wall protein RBR3 isoform X2 n=1 Tax=Pundamilia nyererei TaxID=303518 RepID=A0A9Y3VGW3_9CICH|nr:PREDICTED: PHD finger protein 11 isoform X2 [Pundamilia nyererei]